MKRFLAGLVAVVAAGGTAVSGPVQAAEDVTVVADERPCERLVECTPRTLLLSAFGLEADVYLHQVEDRHAFMINGFRFTTGVLRGQPVVIALTNISIPSAVMAAQLAVDNFSVERIIMSGIAGAVDPDLAPGDVAVPERWALVQETWFQNPEADGGYVVPDVAPMGLHLADGAGAPGEPAAQNFDFMFLRSTTVTSAADPQYEDAAATGFPASGQRFWFGVDADLAALARDLPEGVALQDCATPAEGAEPICASGSSGRAPRLVVDGNGASGSAFVNHAGYRRYLFDTLTVEDAGQTDRVQVVDMETAGVAFVAATNQIPFLAVRSVSDLAGGEASENLLPVFADLAIANTSAVVLGLLEGL